MNCCPNCFSDKEIIGFIQTNSTQTGNCDFCTTQNTPIIPCGELYDTFQELFSTYKVPEPGFTGDAPKYLFQHLKSWGIFNLIQDATIATLTKTIGYALYVDEPGLFDQEVIPRIFEDAQYQHLPQNYVKTWTDLKEEIKYTNRFFVKNILDFDEFKKLLRPFERIYKKGKLFYRARNCDINGLDLVNMGKPPVKLTTAGRANPQGISYLYLSNDTKTTMYEVRATLYDYVTVAEFELKEEIKIASLRNTEKISPFILEDISAYLLYRSFLSVIETDLIKPLRRHDSELDYLPTQYLCEYIKSLDYDGVEYSSSLNPTGFNIALFNDDKITCKSVQMYEVQSINYDYNVFPNP